jgi:hypothetical protein
MGGNGGEIGESRAAVATSDGYVARLPLPCASEPNDASMVVKAFFGRISAGLKLEGCC